jgi:hypothetical protein
MRCFVAAALRTTAVAAPLVVQILMVAMLAENGLEGPFGRMATVEFFLLLQVAAGLAGAVLLGLARLAAGRWGQILPVCVVFFATLAVEDAVLYLVALSPV